MSTQPTIRLNIPKSVKRGEIFEIRSLIMHPMDNGFRFTTAGVTYPIHILYLFTCTYNGEEILSVDMRTGMAANPLLTFYAEAKESGTLEFTWYDDNGAIYTDTAEIEVV